MAEWHSTEEKWYGVEVVSHEYQRYVKLIGMVVDEDHALFIAPCSQCQGLFATKTCNRHHDKIYCPFGCRQMKKKERNRKRSKKYYGSSKGRKNKKKHNRARSIQNFDDDILEEQEGKKEVDPLVSYAKLLLDSIWKKDHELSEINDLFKKVRSRSLDSIDLSDVLDQHDQKT